MAHGMDQLRGRTDRAALLEFQMRLTAYNADRFKPGLPEEAASREPGLEHRVASAEVAFVEAQRKAIARLSRAYQRTPAALIGLAPHRERLTLSPPFAELASTVGPPECQLAAKETFRLYAIIALRPYKTPHAACLLLRDHDDTRRRNNFVCFKVLLRAPQRIFPWRDTPRR